MIRLVPQNSYVFPKLAELLGIKYSRLNSVSNTVSSASTHVSTGRRVGIGNPQQYLQEKGVIDSGFSRHVIGNMSYLTDFEEIDGGYVAFGGNPKGGKITGRGTLAENLVRSLYGSPIGKTPFGTPKALCDFTTLKI
ncbi:hypothetical protein Tco_1012480 [Tanacetum coccineum]